MIYAGVTKGAKPESNVSLLNEKIKGRKPPDDVIPVFCVHNRYTDELSQFVFVSPYHYKQSICSGEMAYH